MTWIFFSLSEYSPLIRHHRLGARRPGSEHHKKCWWRGSVIEFSCSFVKLSCVTLYIHTYISIHTHTYTYTLYIHTVMDQYAHILCLTLTFSCQTTFISSSSEIMNCVCPFLDYVTWLHHHEWCSTGTTVSWYISTHLHIYIHSNAPFRVRIRIHIRDRKSHIHLLCSDSYSNSKQEFEFELVTLTLVFGSVL